MDTSDDSKRSQRGQKRARVQQQQEKQGKQDKDKDAKAMTSSSTTGSNMMTPWRAFGQDWFRANMDIVERDKEFVVSLDVPGIPAADVKLEVQDGVLNISGERKTEKKVCFWCLCFLFLLLCRFCRCFLSLFSGLTWCCFCVFCVAGGDRAVQARGAQLRFVPAPDAAAAERRQRQDHGRAGERRAARDGAQEAGAPRAGPEAHRHRRQGVGSRPACMRPDP